MKPVAIETEESTTEECTCGPFTLVRYRDIRQEPTAVYGVEEINYYDNDDWLVLTGRTEIDGPDGVELFIARQDDVLSVERVG